MKSLLDILIINDPIKNRQYCYAYNTEIYEVLNFTRGYVYLKNQGHNLRPISVEFFRKHFTLIK